MREVALDNLQRISLDGGSQAPKVVYGRTEVGRYFLFNVYGLSRLPNHALFGVVSLQFFFFFFYSAPGCTFPRRGGTVSRDSTGHQTSPPLQMLFFPFLNYCTYRASEGLLL